MAAVPAESIVEDRVLPHVRPRFRVLLRDITPEEICDKIEAALEQPDSTIAGKVNPWFISLRVPAAERHYWSPQLNITIEETEDGNLLRGVYGPRPAVWTMFVFFYFIIALLVVFISIIGLSNLSLGNGGTILWWVPVLLAIFSSLYLTSRFGERLGRHQLHVLHDFTERALDIKFSDHHH